MKARDDNIKWITTTEYIDIETGEIISKSLYEREYIKIKNEKTIKIIENGNDRNKKIGEIKWQTQCRKNPQQTIQFS